KQAEESSAPHLVKRPIRTNIRAKVFRWSWSRSDTPIQDTTRRRRPRPQRRELNPSKNYLRAFCRLYPMKILCSCILPALLAASLAASAAPLDDARALIKAGKLDEGIAQLEAASRAS